MSLIIKSRPDDLTECGFLIAKAISEGMIGLADKDIDSGAYKHE